MPEENDKKELQNLVDASYRRCLMGGTFTRDFYDLFLKNEEISEKFVNVDMERQMRLLDGGIRYLILFYHDPNFITLEKMIQLGKSHAKSKLNIAPHLYDVFQDILLKTVEDNDPKFNIKIENSWRDVACHGISVMKSMYEN